MIRFAFRITPWPLLLLGCGVVTGLMTCVALWPAVMWPLQGTSVGLLAFAMDERCAGVVDTLPRPLWWRTVGRGLFAVPVTAALWAVSLWSAGDRLPDHRGVFVPQGVAATIGALAVSAHCRANGIAEPGGTFRLRGDPGHDDAGAGAAMDRAVPVFPVWPSEDWSRAQMIWMTLLVASVVVLASTFVRKARGRPASRPGL